MPSGLFHSRSSISSVVPDLYCRGDPGKPSNKSAERSSLLQSVPLPTCGSFNYKFRTLSCMDPYVFPVIYKCNAKIAKLFHHNFHFKMLESSSLKFINIYAEVSQSEIVSLNTNWFAIKNQIWKFLLFICHKGFDPDQTWPRPVLNTWLSVWSIENNGQRKNKRIIRCGESPPFRRLRIYIQRSRIGYDKSQNLKTCILFPSLPPMIRRNWLLSDNFSKIDTLKCFSPQSVNYILSRPEVITIWSDISYHISIPAETTLNKQITTVFTPQYLLKVCMHENGKNHHPTNSV